VLVNIAITGANGFIATEMANRFKSTNYVENIYLLTRSNIDLLREQDVSDFFDKNNVDVVLHCAISGGRRGHEETPDMFFKNIKMFEILAMNRHKYGILINFGSGAEADRTRDIMSFTEEDFLSGKQKPFDHYGFSKFLIAKRIQQIDSNIVNFRIFNVFGVHEKNDRMIKNNIVNNKLNKPFLIHSDKIMDFFSADDLFCVIEHYVHNKNFYLLDKDINICYINKTSLSVICKIISSIGNQQGGPSFLNEKRPSYCGDGRKLNDLGLALLGLEGSIKKMYYSLESK